MAYRLTRNAEKDLIGIYVGGVGELGEAVAEKYQAGLHRVFGFLSDFPYSARERAEISPPVRAHPYKSHIIVYIIEGQDILILGVRHGREDWQASDQLS